VCNHAHRIAAAALAILLSVDPCAADEEILSVAVTDAETGAPLPGARCILVDVKAGAEYASFDGPRYLGPRAPVPGDRLYVYLLGYDVTVWTFPEEAARPRHLDLTISPARQFCTIAIEGDEAASLRYSLTIHVLTPLRWPQRVDMGDDPRENCKGPERVTIPKGAAALILPRCEEGLLSPHAFYGLPGETHRLHFDRDQIVQVQLDEVPEGVDPTAIEVLPDFLWTPRASPVQIDAWRLGVNRAGWGRDGLLQRPRHMRLRPAVPVHLFARFRGDAVYRYLPVGTKALDLRGPHERKRIAARPLVDGRPLPANTCLAPGRLDLYAISTLVARRRDLAGCCLMLGLESGEWQPAFLPPAECLTAWHPTLGLIHMEWADRGAPSGVPYPGAAEVSVAPGFTARGYVSVFPTWKGGGRGRATPPDGPLRKKFDPGVRELRFPGLPMGMYAMEVQVELADASGAPVPEQPGSREFELVEEAPTHRVVLGAE